MNPRRIACFFLVLMAGEAAIRAQVVPSALLEYQTPYNLISLRGVPISTVPSNGSDGRAPTVASQVALGLTPDSPTTNQFQGLSFFGGFAPVGNWIEGNNLALTNNTLRGVRIGAPWMSQRISLLFGDVITPPATDELGNKLPPSAPATNALSFNGVNSYVQVTNGARLDTDTYPLTISAWIKTTDTSASEGGIINKYRSSSFNGYNLYLNNGRVHGWYYRNLTNNVSGLDGGFVADGAWHHVALTIDQTGGKLYVDGVLKISRNWINPPGPSTSPEPVRLGYYPGPGSNGYFRGQISQAQVWNVARTALEIQEALYQPPSRGEPGLIAYWDFHEGGGASLANSAVPTDYPGTLLNGTAWAQGGPGIVLDGVDDFVEVAENGNLNFYPLTVAARIKTTGDPANHEAGIVNKYRSASQDGYNLFIAGGRLQAWYFSGRNSSVYVLDGGPVADGEWHHVAMVVDSAGGRLYVDGVEKQTQPWTGTPAPSTSAEPLRVGLYPGGTGGRFKGQIEDVQIWNVARTGQQIANSVGASPTGSEPGLVLYWKFNEGSGTAVADSSTLPEMQGLLVNSPTWTSEPVVPGSELYWLAQPNGSSYFVVTTNVTLTNTVFSTNLVMNPDYYWSPHARKVFATQPGPISIEWRKALPAGATEPPAPPPGAGYRYEKFSGFWYLIYTRSYVVSSSPIQAPRRIYWTEGVFRETGKPVIVPAARVPAVTVAFNRLFPSRVDREYRAPGQTFITESNRLEELRTLWFDQSLGQILAYNQEGRVFMELLGDVLEGSRRQHLGFEIVDVLRQPSPDDVVIELGERLTAYPGGVPSDANLFPEPLSLVGQPFAFRHNINGSGRVEYFATRETQFLNDFLVHWIEEGREGLRWPFRYIRYQLVWPDDVAKYSHYLRPLVATEEEAKATAVQLPRDNAPTIEYQDPFDQPRAKLTDKFELYTHLTAVYPAHRTLVRYVSGDNVAFERVFSWLDDGLKQPNFANAIMKGLKGWNSDPAQRWNAVAAVAPRLLTQTVAVGQRIQAPAGESGTNAAGGYLAGYIQRTNGNAFNVNAYINPFAQGFEAAALGSIIPVNAIPSQNSRMEVWWFRDNQKQGGGTQLDSSKGFRKTYWPSVIATYDIVWPTSSAGEIVLASGNGSGRLDELSRATGRIYAQANPSLDGYNPNEEHALMLDGKAWAIRDDLNITSGPMFSSEPYVLMEFTGADGRPDMRAFKVLREKPAEGLIFDYAQVAGTVLQPPMPLAKLGAPFAPKKPGRPRLTLNHETPSALVHAAESTNASASVRRPPEEGGTETQNVPVTQIATTVQAPFQAWQPLVLQNRGDLSQQRWFYPTGQVTTTSMIGYASSRPLIACSLVVSTVGAPTYQVSDPAALPLSGILPAFDPSTKTMRHALVLASSSNSVTLGWYPVLWANGPIHNPTNLFLVVAESVSGTLAGWRVATDLLPPGITNDAPLQGLYAGYTFKDRKGDTQIYRGPHNPARPGFMSMQFYYATLPTFHFPSLPWNQQPPVGTITPYLTPRKLDGAPATEVVFGNRDSDDQAGDGNALPVLYRPFWPVNTPVLDMAQTLTKPLRGLPDVRGQVSLQILYQQSQATNSTTHRSAVLHDPTRHKTFDFGPPGQPQTLTILDQIPESIPAAATGGKTYFPGLPPHLVNRLYLDPDASPYGTLVLKGEFFDETIGESYLLPNVLGQLDVETLKNLPAAGDARALLWKQAIDGLATSVKLFAEDPNTNRAGTYTNISARLVKAREVAELKDDDEARDSYALTAVGPGIGYVTLIANNGLPHSTPPELPVSVYILRVTNELHRGELKVVEAPNPLSETLTLQQVVDLAGQTDQYDFEWRIAPPEDGKAPTVYDTSSGQPVDVTTSGGKWLPLLPSERYRDGIRAVLGGNADVQALGDNYLIMRYRARQTNHASWVSAPGNPGVNIGWSRWTAADVLAEGWIKRVLKGINPFNQRVTDLLNNPISTDVSLLAQAGHKWEGDVALNQNALNNAGLIEIYETVLNRGKNLSINANINYGPANDALLLAAGYLNDLYMMIGNEGLADASNPTIGIGTANSTYGSIATALFSFKGQVPSVLDEELVLLRGRDDSLAPGVEIPPFYNRFVWNYTRGIDAGQAIYALNYNILDQNADGVVDEKDAARLYPQGHGDAYGHYLTALKGYYSLLMRSSFDWVPRSEAVNVYGKAVAVDYQDERKFAAAAGALARTGKQVFDLTWRKGFKSGPGNGWEHFRTTRANTTTRLVATTNYWGMDHWAFRTGQGAYLNWIVGNAILPARDPNTNHLGSIQQVDRTTVPELTELPSVMESLQTSLDNAENGLNPLGLPATAIPFDLNPLSIANGPNSHFEQIFARAKGALNNAVVAFDDAKDVTRLMRSEEDSLDDFRTKYNQQELAYTNALIEIYGTPYTDDMEPGGLYGQDYAGPDFHHYFYVDLVETSTGLLRPEQPYTIRIDTQTFVPDWVDLTTGISDFRFIRPAYLADGIPQIPDYVEGTNYFLEFTLGTHGFFQKPAHWKGRRRSPGELQQAISDIIKARNAAYLALYNIDAAKGDLDWALMQFNLQKQSHETIRQFKAAIVSLEEVTETTKAAYEIAQKYLDQTKEQIASMSAAVSRSLPTVFIAGLAAGGDLTSPARSAIEAAGVTFKSVTEWEQVIAFSVITSLELANSSIKRFIEFNNIDPEEYSQQLRETTSSLRDKVYGMQNRLPELNARLQELDDAQRKYRSLLARADRLETERKVSRQRAAAVIQGFRTRDAAFRIFRNEKLERYKSLFDLAAQYAYMSAQAYDYDTGLLGTQRGREFVNRIVRARSLGVIQDGQPQFAGSNTGDPGLSSVLAEMAGDWSVVRSRLGFNNPDAYGTTVSLRTENFRFLPGTNGTDNWVDLLNKSRKANLLDDPDVRQSCMQIDPGDGLPVPGIVIEFSTTISDGLNLFGKPLAPGDHAFSPSSFATKIFAMGVALEGYKGMDDPTANGSAIDEANAASPPDPDLAFLDSEALAANPYVYLIPAGVDSMRSPPLGDSSAIRTWVVHDVAVPLPFNIGGSELSSATYYQSADSLTEVPFTVRKHQAFRPVSSASVFGTLVVYWTGGELERTQYTNTRLLGRSAWNTKWKLVIPGRTLLNSPDEGLDRFIRSVRDVKLYFHTYSYSGN